MDTENEFYGKNRLCSRCCQHHEILNITILIDKWKTRFSGDDGDSLLDFLWKIEMNATADRITKSDIFPRIHKLLEGTALRWFEVCWSSIRNWDHFVFEIKNRFLPIYYEYYTQEDILARKQADGESFPVYLTEMENLFRKIYPPLEEQFKVYVLKRNILTKYSSQMVLFNFKTVAEICRFCKQLDEYQLMTARREQTLQIETPLEPSCWPNSENPIRERDGIRQDEACEIKQQRDQIKEDMVRKGNSRCWRCHRVGHRRRDCDRRKKENSVISSSRRHTETTAKKGVHNRTTTTNTKSKLRKRKSRKTLKEYGNERNDCDRIIRNHQGIKKDRLRDRPTTTNKIETNGTTEKESDIPLELDCVLNLEGDMRPHLEVEVLGYTIVGLLDSGASCTILGGEVYPLLKKLGLELIPVRSSVKTADGSKHVIQHCADVPFVVKEKCKVIRTYIVPSITRELILGIDFWKAFDITPKMPEISMVHHEEKEEESGEDGMEPWHTLQTDQKYDLSRAIEAFLVTEPDKLGCTKMIKHSIDTGNAKGVRVRARPVSPYVQKDMNDELDRMIKLGVIEEAGPTEWAHPIVCVRKPSGKLRFCLDARRLNEVTVKDTYPLPYINRILGRLSGTKFLSCIDLSDAFWQVELDEASRAKTAFIVPGRGLFQYKRMPFGLCNASQSLCRLMDEVLGMDLEPRVFVYLDDIVVMSQTFEEHVKLLKEVALRLRKANLTISLEKSRFCLREIKYLGFVLDEFGLRVDPEKVNGVLNFQAPKCVKDVRRLIGLAGWYRRFIPNFSAVTAPITNLLKKADGKRFQWSTEAQTAFTELKSLLVSAPILVNPDFSKLFTIQTDASDTGMGAVLTQGEGDDERVIAYMSQKLTATQRKYPATERECLAVVTAIEKFRPYIEGVGFRVVTDCASLLWLRSLKDPASRLARWAMRLQQFDFELLHRKGRFNVVPDALSRAVEIIEFTEQDVQDDAEYADLMNKVINNPEKFSDLQVRGGVLFRHCQEENDDGAYVFVWRRYVPAGLRAEVLRENHDDPLAAHFGFYKTLRRVQQTYYWPGMSKDIRRYVAACEKCQINKHGNEINRAPMGEQKVVSQPWEVIAVDYLGPLPRSKKGNKYLIVIVDVFSKFCILKPIRRAESNSLIDVLKEYVFLLFGVPSRIVSDNGSQFTSRKFKGFSKSYQVNPAERLNRVNLAAFCNYVGDDQRNWDEYMPEISCAIRTSKHESSRYEPYYINFGRQMWTSGAQDVQSGTGDANEDAKELAIRMKKICVNVKENLKRAYTRYAHNYNLRSKPKEFDVGDIVLRTNFKLSKAADNYNSKLDNLFNKCRIRAKLGSYTYTLEDMNGKLLGNYHANNLRKFIMSSEM